MLNPQKISLVIINTHTHTYIVYIQCVHNIIHCIQSYVCMYVCIQFSELFFVACMYVCSVQTLWDCITYHRVLHWRRLNLPLVCLQIFIQRQRIVRVQPFCHYADIIWMAILLRFHGYSSLIISRQYNYRVDVVVF